MRIPLIAGNWKMNTTVSQARELAAALVIALDDIAGVKVVLCPPFVSLLTVKEAIQVSSLKLGAQNMHHLEKGAYTGEVSPVMLHGLCDYVILGHSERRHILGEDDELINKKVQAALKMGLKPILCVGETLEERDGGATDEVLIRQVTRGLEGINTPSGIVIAYEPIWAIGTGRPATGANANATIGLIRRTLAAIFDEKLAGETRFLYGGSVTPDNIGEFIAEPEIDGALVGGASLRALDFVEIVRHASGAKAG